jgi:hypothetical protein
MSAFEYASVVVSIILALGIADILRFLADTFRDWNPRRFYWLHFLWMILLLEAHVEFWLRMWDFRTLVDVGPMLSVLLTGPALLFMATRALMPLPGGETTMEDLYFGNRKIFFAVLILMSLWSFAVGPWQPSGNPVALPLYGALFTLILMSAFVACMFSSNRRLHQAVVLTISATEVLELFSQLGTSPAPG